MPFAYAGAAVGIASGVNSLVNSGGGGSPGTPQGAGGGSPFVYQPTGQPQQDTNFQNILNSMYGVGQTQPGQIYNNQAAATNALVTNPFIQPYMNAQAQAGQAAGALAPQEMGAGKQLFGAGGQVLNTAFDPQQALYNRTQQQITDQSNAINSMYGLSSSPAGAGLTQKALSDFNIDWQNQQLKRQLEGVSGAGRAFAGGADLGNAAVSSYGQAGSLPYQGWRTIYGNQFQDFGNQQSALSQSFGLDQATLNNIQSYLRLGQSAGANALAQQQQRFGQAQTGADQLGNALGGLSQLYGSGNPFTGSAVPNMYPYAAQQAGVDPQTFMFGGDTATGYGTFPSGGGGGY
jgi:hypothetical protein